MNIQVERLPECRALIRIEAPKDTVETERTIIVKGFAAQANIPGFRKGKVPQNVIEQRYATDIKSELEQRLVSAGLRETAEKEKLEILSVQEVSEQDYRDDGTFSCLLSLTLSPEFELPDYKAIPVRLPRMEMGEEQIDQSLEGLRERYATFADIEDRGAAMGDLLIVNYEGTLDGVPVTEAIEDAPPTLGKAAAQWMKMDEEGFLPGFCNDLVDVKTGESKEVTVTLDEEFPVESLRGKELVFQVEVTAIKIQELPEVDDEFANKVREGMTLEELRAEISRDLESGWEEQMHNQKVNQVVAYLDENTEFEVPADVVASEAQSRADEITADAVQRGMGEDEVINHQDEIIETASRQARVNVKTAFLLESIAQEEKIQPNDQELTGAIMNMAQRQGVSPKKLINDLKKNNGISTMRHNLMTQKALAFLVDHVVVTEFDPADEPAEES